MQDLNIKIPFLHTGIVPHILFIYGVSIEYTTLRLPVTSDIGLLTKISFKIVEPQKPLHLILKNMNQIML